MRLTIVARCKECYEKKYGELKECDKDIIYRTIDEDYVCEICGKQNAMVITAEKPDEHKI